MDSKTQDRILKAASDYADKMDANNDYQNGRKCGCEMGYIAGATAENSRAQVLVDALEEIERRIKVGKAGASYQIEMIRPVVIKALEQWKGKEVEPTPQPTEPQPDLGTCVECKTRPATTDYNGHQHYVCKLCDDSLNREFDEEYR